MSNAPEPLSPGGAVRSVVAWCWREIFTVVLALVVAGFLLVTPHLLAATTYQRTDTFLAPPGPAAVQVFSLVAGACVVAGVLLAKRSALLATALTLLPFLVVPWWQAFVWGWFLGTIAVATVAATVSWRHAVPPYVAAVAISAFYCLTVTPAVLPIGFVTAGSTSGSRSVVFVLYLVAITAVVAISASIAATTASIAALERAQRQELAAVTQEAYALEIELVVGERAQVARDLHDVVAHHVSLVAVRAESAPYQYPDLGDDARAVLTDIAEDARQALGELRQVLVVLQRAEPGGDGQASRVPQPEAADIDELVLSARAAGQRVEVEGAWGSVPSAQGYVLYRAVQEGLTNARRHAPRAVAVLTRTHVGSTISFTLTNPATGSGAGEPGRGIVGMRERVESLGGSMSAGIVADRFELAVTLPVAVGTDEHRIEVDA